MNRAERKRAVKEDNYTKVHRNWTQQPSPKQKNYGNGWVRELDRAYLRNDNSFVVMTRRLQTEWGEVIHATISTADGRDVAWNEKQLIKNELFGEEAQAVEVFPKESEFVDDADMYHLWILENDFKIPFTLKE